MLGTKPSIGAGLAITSQRDTPPMAEPARKRPLRTYGRRTNAPAQDSERKFSTQRKEDMTAPPSPEVDLDMIMVAMDDCESSSPSPSLSPPSRRSESSKPNRNSILSYFKPVSHTPPEVANDSDDAGEESLSPLPSPDSTSLPRKRRRLTTRPDIICKPNSTSVGEDRREEAKLIVDENRDAPLKGKRKLQDISPKGAHGAPFIAVTTPPDVLLHRNTSSRASRSSSDENDRPHHHQNPLRETSRSSLNKMDADNQAVPSSSPETETAEDDNITEKKPSSSSGGNRKMTTTKRKKKHKDLVQTTLSLAINPGPGFMICKECGILYNHLNENDRKEHKRRHAAYVRGKPKGGS